MDRLGWLVALSLAAGGAALAAESADSTESLAERSAVVFSGEVVRPAESAEPRQPASEATVVVRVIRMYAGAAIAGDQSGQEVTVILAKPGAVKKGAKALFLGNPRSVGETLTVADEGETAASKSAVAAAERGIEARAAQPVRRRIASAGAVFRGKVESVKPLAREAERVDEHDPEWQVAEVRVVSPLRGGRAGALVTVLFPGSRDVTWFNSPKLAAGQEALFITHREDEATAASLRSTPARELIEKRGAELVTDPADVLPLRDEPRVRRALGAGKGPR